MIVSSKFIKEFYEHLKKDYLGLIGAIIVLAFIIIAILAPYIVPYPNDAWGYSFNTSQRLQPPSFEHPFGTDAYGRDVFSRVILASRFSLFIALSVVSLSLLIGVIIELFAGYIGGRIGELFMRITDMFLAFPPILLALLFATILGRGLFNLIISLSLAWWPWYARLTYVQVTTVKNMPYIDAAKIAGIGTPTIVFKYVLPNSITPVTVQAFLDMGAVILEASALSFIGIGVQPPNPEWGLMISEGWYLIGSAWWLSIFPGMMLFLVVMAFNFLGDSFREFNNPKVRNLIQTRRI